MSSKSSINQIPISIASLWYRWVRVVFTSHVSANFGSGRLVLKISRSIFLISRYYPIMIGDMLTERIVIHFEINILIVLIKIFQVRSVLYIPQGPEVESLIRYHTSGPTSSRLMISFWRFPAFLLIPVSFHAPVTFVQQWPTRWNDRTVKYSDMFIWSWKQLPSILSDLFSSWHIYLTVYPRDPCTDWSHCSKTFH